MQGEDPQGRAAAAAGLREQPWHPPLSLSLHQLAALLT